MAKASKVPTPYSYQSVELMSLNAVAARHRKGRLDGETEGQVKQIHALCLQSVQRHGKNVPARVVYGEVYRAVYRQQRKAIVAKFGPFIALFIPVLIGFIQQLFPIILDQIIAWLNSLSESEQPVALRALSEPAKVRWSLEE